jgi:Kef-type K+ transport system membrane component KefB/predicted transcriptional regulator
MELLAVLDAVLYLALLVLSARVLEELMLRLRQSQMLGDVLAGLVVGPAMLNVVAPSIEIKFLMDLGLYFFFFIIGFQEIDLFTLRRSLRKRLFPAAVVAFIVPSVACYIFMNSLGFSEQMSVIASGIIGISSLGVVTRILMDLKLLRSPLGLEIFGFVAIIEFLGLLYVSVLLQLLVIDISTSLLFILVLAAKFMFFFLVVGAISFLFAPRLLTFIKRRMKAKEASFGVVASVVLIVVWFSELVGVHGAIGALILGLGLSRLSDSPEHVEVIQGFRSFSHGVFVPVFFAGAGLYFSFSFLNLSLRYVLIFVVIALVGKFAGAYAGAKLGGIKNASFLGAGAIAKGGVELALLLSTLELGILNTEMFSLILFTIFALLFIAPLLLRGVTRELRPDESPSVIEESAVPLYCRYAYTTFRVKDVMSSPKARVSSDTTVERFLKQHIRLGYRNYFVVDRRERLVGLLRVTDLSAIPQKKQKRTLVKDVMRLNVPVVYPETTVHAALETLMKEGLNRMPVVSPEEPTKVIGTFDKGDAIKIMFLGKEQNVNR